MEPGKARAECSCTLDGTGFFLVCFFKRAWRSRLTCHSTSLNSNDTGGEHEEAASARKAWQCKSRIALNF